MVTIATYFPEAEVQGCDVDLEIAQLRDGLPGPVFFSTSEAIAENGPYDIIFANSVVCHHPSVAGQHLHNDQAHTLTCPAL